MDSTWLISVSLSAWVKRLYEQEREAIKAAQVLNQFGSQSRRRTGAFERWTCSKLRRSRGRRRRASRRRGRSRDLQAKPTAALAASWAASGRRARTPRWLGEHDCPLARLRTTARREHG